MSSNLTRTTNITMTKHEKIEIIRRWMEYCCITLDDLGLVTPLERVTDIMIEHLLELAEEDRSRFICDGCFIKEDWTEAL